MSDLHAAERERFEAFISKSDDFTHWQLWCAALSAPAVPQWIPVSERLPDVDKARCFVISPGASSGDLWPTEWNADNKVFEAAFGGCFERSEVTHWMYADQLPAAPSAKEPQT